VVVDVQEMTFEVELDTRGIGSASMPTGAGVDNSQDMKAYPFRPSVETTAKFA